MLDRSFCLVWVAVIVMLFAVHSFAAEAPREVYASLDREVGAVFADNDEEATEEVETAPAPEALAPKVAAKPAQETDRAKALEQEVTSLKAELARLKVPTAPAVEKKKAEYDAVPAEHVASVVKRLKAVEKLMREYGRAYDYRAHTLAEFENLLRQLRAEKAAQAARAAALRDTTPVLD